MIKIAILILIIYAIYIKFIPGYIEFYPTLPIYPSNKNELELVKSMIKERTLKFEELFFQTNYSVAYAFKPYVNESLDELQKISIKDNHIIKLFKYLINRRRPWQIDSSISPLNIDTAQTPSYPAGHAYQAHILYKVLSKRYPYKKNLFKKISLNCDYCRIKAGLHYPSDGVFSRKIVELLY